MIRKQIAQVVPRIFPALLLVAGLAPVRHGVRHQAPAPPSATR